MAEDGFRVESDSMGDMPVPASALYGAQTARARANFPVSGYRLPPAFLRALGLVKWAAARANTELGRLEARKGDAIARAALELSDGDHLAHFPLDVFQTGSGTSTNMNANEVIANRAIELLGGTRGDRALVHPNDDVNCGQSSNDVVPTALHVATLERLQLELAPALHELTAALRAKADELQDVITVGRTHLMDATPIRRGESFAGYARQVEQAIEALARLAPDLAELPLGGTAVGTGLNTHPQFAARAIAHIGQRTGRPWREAASRFASMGAKDAIVATSGALRGLAVALTRIAHDIRQLASGPRCGLGELVLPAVAPGSSIMPGKVNPVMAESLLQVCAWVIGNDLGCALGGLGGLGSNLELNTMMPLLAFNVLESIRVLAAAVRAFTGRCVVGITADAARARELVEKSLMNVTRLVPRIGYDKAAWVAKEALTTGRSLREVVLAAGLLAAPELDRLLDPRSMLAPEA